MAAPAASHIYVYYRVAVETTAARAPVAELMAAVEAKTGVGGRLLARCDDSCTWMEVYEPVSDVAAFKRTLAALVAHYRVTDIAEDGVRHTECFAPPTFAAPAPRTRVKRAAR